MVRSGGALQLCQLLRNDELDDEAALAAHELLCIACAKLYANDFEGECPCVTCQSAMCQVCRVIHRCS